MIGLVCVAAYTYGLGFPSEPYFDEVYHVPAAREIATLHGYPKTGHPPFARTLIAFAIMILGDKSWAWRLVPLLFGLACIGVLFLITKRITRNNGAAFFSAFIFAFDGLAITQARITMLNSTMLLWMLLAVLALLPYGIDRAPCRTRSFLASGIFLGLGLASRWMAGGICGVLTLILAKAFLEEKQRSLFIRDFFFVLSSGRLRVMLRLTASSPFCKDTVGLMSGSINRICWTFTCVSLRNTATPPRGGPDRC